MAASLLLALIALGAADGFRTKNTADRYADEARRLHQGAFPEAAQSDPGAHARRILSSGGEASFLALSGFLAQALEDNQDVSIDRIRFDETRGQFVFTIKSASDANIETFRLALSVYGIEAAETGGYRRSGAYWVGEMTARL